MILELTPVPDAVPLVLKVGTFIIIIIIIVINRVTVIGNISNTDICQGLIEKN